MRRRKRLVAVTALAACAVLLIVCSVIGQRAQIPGRLGRLMLVDRAGKRVPFQQVLKRKTVVALLDAGCDQCIQLAVVLGVANHIGSDSSRSLVSVFFNDPETLRVLGDRYGLGEEVYCAGDTEPLSPLRSGLPRLLFLEDGRVIRQLGPGLAPEEYAGQILEFLQSDLKTNKRVGGIRGLVPVAGAISYSSRPKQGRRGRVPAGDCPGA